ncbi:Pycsar system effector family protein [Leisingera caerulea]|uniref:Pycsar system effector family protein n=1 Tax=Leisingera caerulea TaxID=506591 RepID=UPI0021A5A61F|nr:Pycsar system effector family protein [Leisingera caerulea]UWQ84570.1 hypothetical protein K3726_05040 [Leisingera caerulea]
MEEEKLRWVLERQLAWIASADAKLTVVGPIPFAMLAISLVKFGEKVKAIEWLDAPLIASTFLLLIVMFHVASALTPRLNGPEFSNIFFGKISLREEKEFTQSILSEEANQHKSDLVGQVYINAKIAHYKHQCVGRAIFYLVFAAPIWLIALAVG